MTLVWPYGHTAFSGASGPSQSPIKPPPRMWRVLLPAQPDSLHCPPGREKEVSPVHCL